MESTQELIWMRPEWPGFQYDKATVASKLAEARRAQGFAEGKLTAIGLIPRQEIMADAWSQEALATAAIEGERLNIDAVRSSVARRLGNLNKSKAAHTPRHIDGLLDIMDDAVHNAHQPLTHERVQAWQAALFPTGFSGMTKIVVGAYRTGQDPMQIVSGGVGKEKIHYVAPSADALLEEMGKFLDWLNQSDDTDNIVRAAIAHLWFESIHPFEDGNGRVGRAIVDLMLARDAGEASRLFRISQRLLELRDEYYDELEDAQHGRLDVTRWVLWFVEQFRCACVAASKVIDLALEKGRFWTLHSNKDLTVRQRKVVNLLLDAGPGGFEGGMSTKKYESIADTSRATASRELVDLEQNGLLRSVGNGRATRYYINLDGWAN